MDADTSISEMLPTSTLLCPKHGVLPREVGIYLRIHGVIHFPGDRTLNTHRPCQNSRNYSPASHRRGLGSIPESFIWILFFCFLVNKLTLGQVLTEYVDFSLSVIFHQCYILLLVYLFNQSFINLPVTLYNLSKWQRRWILHFKKLIPLWKPSISRAQNKGSYVYFQVPLWPELSHITSYI